MVVKFIIGDKGKAWRIEMPEADVLHGKNVGDMIHGKELKHELEGYELEITGGSDAAGFPLSKNVEGVALKGLLLTKGFGMRDNAGGMRRRKSVRGKTISANISQINMKVLKHGHKKLEEVFPDQNSGKVEEKKEEKKA